MSTQHDVQNGHDELIQVLDQAASQESVDAKTSAVEAGLRRLIAADALSLPEEVQIAGDASYARRLLYKSERWGYAVVVMAWGPNQGTPLHDHAGTWCVEGVWKGELKITQFNLVEKDDVRFRFDPQSSVIAGPGSAGSLIPPFEYHTIKNSLNDQTSITIHVYGQELTQCSIFEPEDNLWFVRRTRALTYDN